MNHIITEREIFSSQNPIENITDADYEMVNILIDAVKALERNSFQVVYIIDHFKKQFLYFSDNISNICDEDVDIIKELGYKFYLDYVPDEDLKMFTEINSKGFKLLDTIPMNEKKDYVLSCNFRIKSRSRPRLVTHKQTPLKLTDDGKIWLTLCSISFPTGKQPGQIIMRKRGADFYYEYSLVEHNWNRIDEIKLTDTEKEVLRYSAQGYTMDEIGEKIFKSIDTVKAAKRSIFKKMDAKNISEALTYLQNHKLL